MMGPFPESDILKGKKKSSAESPEASGMIGGLTPERATEIQTAIAEKTKLRDGLRRTWKEKFEEFKKLKKEQDDEQATMTRLKLAGKLDLSDEDMLESKRAGLEKIEAAGRDAESYLNDARELEQEIEALNAELRDAGN